MSDSLSSWVVSFPIHTIKEEVDPVNNYSIIYTDGPKIISCRGREAFSLGIEDYRVLLLHEKKFGKEKTKAMVWDVISAKDIRTVPLCRKGKRGND